MHASQRLRIMWFLDSHPTACYTFSRAFTRTVAWNQYMLHSVTKSERLSQHDRPSSANCRNTFMFVRAPSLSSESGPHRHECIRKNYFLGRREPAMGRRVDWPLLFAEGLALCRGVCLFVCFCGKVIHLLRTTVCDGQNVCRVSLS